MKTGMCQTQNYRYLLTILTIGRITMWSWSTCGPKLILSLRTGAGSLKRSTLWII